MTTHSDESRRYVSGTARVTAAIRAIETNSLNPLIQDHFAEMLAGSEGMEKSKEPWFNGALCDAVVVRTKCIDEDISGLLAQNPSIKTMITLGSGLDSRAYRLECLKGIQLFELDFGEVHTAKNEALASSETKCNLVQVPVDLSQPTWYEQLISAGYNSASSPCLWLIEGFTGYLYEKELKELLSHCSQISAAGSVMLITFVGNASKRPGDIHKFYCDEPLLLLGEFGWKGCASSIGQLAKRCDRQANIPEHATHFWYCVLKKEQ